MCGIQVQDQDEAHARVRGEGAQDLAEGFYPPGRGSDADDREVGAGGTRGLGDKGRVHVSSNVRATAWDARTPNPRLPFCHDALLEARRAHRVTHPSLERKELRADASCTHDARTARITSQPRQGGRPSPSLTHTPSPLWLAH